MKTCSWNSLFPLVTILVRFKLSSVYVMPILRSTASGLYVPRKQTLSVLLYSKPEKVNKSHTTFSFKVHMT